MKKIGWKNSWVEIKTGIYLSSYHHGQNRHDLRKINLFYCQFFFFWQWETTRPCSVLILHSWLLSLQRETGLYLYVSVVRQPPRFGWGSPEAQPSLLQGQIQISKHRLFPTENYIWNMPFMMAQLLVRVRATFAFWICLVMGMPQPLDQGIQGFLTWPPIGEAAAIAACGSRNNKDEQLSKMSTYIEQIRGQAW